MTKLSFFDVEYAGKRKHARREKFLEEMDRAAPWDTFLVLIEPLHPKPGNGRRPFVFRAMLRIHLMRNWFGDSDPAMEDSLYAVTPLPRLASPSLTRGRVPGETTILNFWRLLERHNMVPKLFAAVSACLTDKGMLLRQGTIVDATLIHIPPSP